MNNSYLTVYPTYIEWVGDYDARPYTGKVTVKLIQLGNVVHPF
jgi:hypothetical protein